MKCLVRTANLQYKIVKESVCILPNACGFFWLLKNFLLYKAVSVIIVKEIVLQKQNELSEYSELHEKYKKY